MIAEEPEVAADSATALLAGDRDVARLRTEIGVRLAERVAAGLGEAHDPAVLRVLTLAFPGAMLQAAMGYFPYDELGDRMAEVATLVLGERT